MLVAPVNQKLPPSLGTALDVLTGDAAGNGAVVAVAGPGSLHSTGPYAADVSPALELRQVGAAPVRLLSTATVRAALHAPQGQISYTAAQFSSDGHYLALACSDFAGNHVPEVNGVILVNRRGHIVRSIPTGSTTTIAWLRWSRTGELAMADQVRGQLLLSSPLTSATLTPVPLPLVLRGTLEAPGVWSPDGKRLVVGDKRGWDVVNARTLKVSTVANVPGPPIAWVGGQA